MPEMGGLEATREIRALGIPCKIVLFSSLTRKGADITLEGLKLGANDFATKPVMV